MFLLSIPTHARRQMNSEYAMALRRVAEVVASAPALPRRLEFTSIVPDVGAGDSRGHVLLTWSCGTRTLRLEFDADGPVDYWCEPDCGPLPGGDDGGLLPSLFAWLAEGFEAVGAGEGPGGPR